MSKVLFGILYWILQLTWGIIATLCGFIATIFSLCFLKGKIHKNGFGFITEVGGNWGGISFGSFALCGSYANQESQYYDLYWYEHTRRHEFGHSIQNAILGPFYFIIVLIPSAIRYWYQVISMRKGKQFSSEWYDSIWFEGQATRVGTMLVDYIEEEKEK